MKKVSVLIPVYNEDKMLPLLCPELKKVMDGESGKYEWEVLFVNDGSKDKTWDIICRLHKENKFVHGVNLAHNVGHQNAIMAGMMTAKDRADAAITIDADLQDDLKAIPQMIDDYAKGYDIIYGVKVSRTADPLMKRLSAQAFYKLQSKMGVNSIYNHADFRFMSRHALEMLSRYKEKNLYLRGIIPTIGLNTTTVEDVISERTAGASKYTLSKMLNLALDGITSFSVKPIYGIIYLGMLFILICLVIGVYVIHALVTGTAVPGWASVILSIWLIGGLNLISIGIVGVYIGKIYKEVKNRPLYNIEEILE